MKPTFGFESTKEAGVVFNKMLLAAVAITGL